MFPRGFAITVFTALVAASCTFPTVDYSSSSCEVPAPCEKTAGKCSSMAKSARMTCNDQCINNACNDCDAKFDMQLSHCIDECEACSKMNGCESPSAACSDMLGLP